MVAASQHNSRFRRSIGKQAPRLAAIRAIVDLAEDDEDHDVATEALMILGASRHEIAAATLESGA
jgi:hypothetical protein